MVLDTANHLYLKVLLSPPEPEKPWNIGLLHLDEQGRIVDSIAVPTMDGEPVQQGGPFSPEKVWAWSPFGYMVVGVNSAYRIDLRQRDGTVIRIERNTPVVQLLPEERAEREAENDWRREYQGQFMIATLPPVPTSKPAYRGFFIGQDGRVWVQRHVTAERIGEPVPATPERPPSLTWREPPVYDVFEPDGTFLGEVRAPNATRLMLARGEHAWGIRTGDEGEEYVVRLRVQRGEDRTLP